MEPKISLKRNAILERACVCVSVFFFFFFAWAGGVKVGGGGGRGAKRQQGLPQLEFSVTRGGSWTNLTEIKKTQDKRDKLNLKNLK